MSASVFVFATGFANRPLVYLDGRLWLAKGNDPPTRFASEAEAELAIHATMAATPPGMTMAERDGYLIEDEPDRVVRRSGRPSESAR